jgi:hypothetical protein
MQESEPKSYNQGKRKRSTLRGPRLLSRDQNPLCRILKKPNPSDNKHDAYWDNKLKLLFHHVQQSPPPQQFVLLVFLPAKNLFRFFGKLYGSVIARSATERRPLSE